MRDDDPDEDGQKSVPTVPPPSGESDIYEARTQVGGLSAEALAMLRQIRDEKPMGGASGELNLQVFVDEPAPVAASAPAIKPANPVVETPAFAPVFTAESIARKAPVAPLVAPGLTVADEPERYESVFAPLPPSVRSHESGSSREPVPPSSPPTWPLWAMAVLVALVFLALVLTFFLRS